MVTRRQHGLTKNQGAVGEGLLDDKKNKKNAVNVVHLDFYKNILRQMEERELDTGNSKELVENYTQENSDPVTCYKVPSLILFYATVIFVPLSKS